MPFLTNTTQRLLFLVVEPSKLEPRPDAPVLHFSIPKKFTILPGTYECTKQQLERIFTANPHNEIYRKADEPWLVVTDSMEKGLEVQVTLTEAEIRSAGEAHGYQIVLKKLRAKGVFHGALKDPEQDDGVFSKNWHDRKNIAETVPTGLDRK